VDLAKSILGLLGFAVVPGIELDHGLAGLVHLAVATTPERKFGRRVIEDAIAP
jgi:hypothetical protein